MELFSTAYWVLTLASLILVPVCVVVYHRSHPDSPPILASLRTRKGRYELVIALAAAFTPLIQIVLVASLGLWLVLVVLHRYAFPEREVF